MCARKLCSRVVPKPWEAMIGAFVILALASSRTIIADGLGVRTEIVQTTV